jgi:hypothetical protein
MNLGFHAQGEIDFVGAKIDGDLDFMGATVLNGEEAWAIVADNVRAMNVYLSSDWRKKGSRFRAEGTVWFPNATISGDFGIYDAEFTAGRGRDDRVALSIERATIGGTLTLGYPGVKSGPPQFAVHGGGEVDLRGTRCGSFEASGWKSPILLDGFTYERIKGLWGTKIKGLWGTKTLDGNTGIQWLELDKTGATQPYRQLAQYFDASGKGAESKEVLIALERRLYPQDDNPLKFLKKAIGYGYKPERAVGGLAIVCAVGWLAYWRSQRMGIMIPSDKDAAEALRTTGKIPAHYPRFNSLIASVENTFPLVKLGQADTWRPDSSPAPPFIGNIRQRLWQSVALRRSLPWIIWAQILLGWLFATLFVAAVAGLIHHGT